jgi:hypothetical protein
VVGSARQAGQAIRQRIAASVMIEPSISASEGDQDMGAKLAQNGSVA